jgi:putative glutamine amidotransferase
MAFSEKPFIGITTSLSEDEQRLSVDYIRAVEDADGLPVIVPVFSDRVNAERFFSLLDGLIITGGPAIEDRLIGTLPEDIGPTDPRRYENDRFFLQCAIDRQVPVLGICYGMQLMNAVLGGSIYADVEAELKLEASHSRKRGAMGHDLIMKPHTRLHELLGPEIENVNTRHIQAIAEIAPPLRESALSSDGVIEGIESENSLLIGVQFHPEKMGDTTGALFSDLVTRANRKRQLQQRIGDFDCTVRQ